ncbi:RNA polymerase sigma factor RpoD [Salmonella enterica]|nr:RNA polymerase sigma factor RpoD [Salmonella enterica]
MRFGNNMNAKHTLEEVGKRLEVTRDGIGQFERRALLRLLYPSRSEVLQSFHDD